MQEQFTIQNYTYKHKVGLQKMNHLEWTERVIHL